MGKVSLICALVVIACGAGSLAGTVRQDSNFMWFPKDDFSGVVPAFLKGVPENSINADPNNIHFYLFTLNNRDTYDVIANTTESLDASHWDKDAPTKIWIHGFSSSWDGGSAGAIREAYINNGYPQNLNLVVVNWKSLAAAPWYEVAAIGTELVGEKVAHLVDFLVKNGYTSLDKVHCFGHSLGAHACGWGGTKYQVLGGGAKFPRISALDPALPLFGVAPDEERIDKSDADFVDVVHSAAGTILEGGLAFTEPRGHVDFYPNTGKRQPGCGLDLAGACSHSRCYEYFTESVHSDLFRSCKCADDAWDDDFDTCDCANGAANMGEWVPATTTGIYYLKTNPASPYAIPAGP